MSPRQLINIKINKKSSCLLQYVDKHKDQEEIKMSPTIDKHKDQEDLKVSPRQ